MGSIARFANGKWQMANGKWQMANGKWQTANRKLPTANREPPTLRRAAQGTICERHQVKRHEGRQRKAADDGECERTLQFGTGAEAQSERQQAEQRAQRRH